MDLIQILQDTHDAYGRLKKATVTIEPEDNNMTCFGWMAPSKGKWPVDKETDPVVALLVCATNPSSELAIVEDAEPSRWPSKVSDAQLSELAYCAMAAGRCGILWCNAGILHMIDTKRILSKGRTIDAIQRSVELGGPTRPRARKFLWKEETYEVPLIKTEDGKMLLDWIRWCVKAPDLDREQGDQSQS